MIPRGRRSDKKSETTEGEKGQLRAVWGSINWVQRESRPDVSALASLGMGSLNHITVQDLCDANVAVERLKAEPLLGVKLPHIPIHHVRWATVQDASWAHAAEDHSQGASLVVQNTNERHNEMISEPEDRGNEVGADGEGRPGEAGLVVQGGQEDTGCKTLCQGSFLVGVLQDCGTICLLPLLC